MTTDTPADGNPALPDAMLARLEQIGETMDGVAKRLQAVSAYGRKTRRLAVGLAVSWLVDVALTVAVTMLSVSALHASSTVHQSQLAACAIGNQTRADQIRLWNFVAELSGGNPGQDKAELRRFLAFVKMTFAPVDCAKVYGQ